MVLEAAINVWQVKIREMVSFLDLPGVYDLSLGWNDLGGRGVARHVLLDSDLHCGVVTILTLVFNIVLLILLLDVGSPRLLVANH